MTYQAWYVDPLPSGIEEYLYPVERTFVGALPIPDGVSDAAAGDSFSLTDAERTLVVAGCDPAVGSLSAELARTADVRVLPLIRSSRCALDLLRSGVVHVAGLHRQDSHEPRGNAEAVHDLPGDGYSLLRVTRWQEGIALASDLEIKSIRGAMGSNLRWVGREIGSGARRCLDSPLGGRHPLPKGYHHIASDHLGVVETIRSGWAQAGVCVRLAAAERGRHGDVIPARV